MALCIPQFSWAPTVTGTPNWFGGGSTDLNDVNWRGALRSSIDANGGQEKFVFRIVHDNAANQLYVSFWVKFDPSEAINNEEDILWFGLQPQNVAANAMIFKLRHSSDIPGSNDPASASRFNWSGAAWAPSGAAFPWLRNLRSWKIDHGATVEWAFQLVIDVAGANLVTAANPIFKMFYQAQVFISELGTTTIHKYPSGCPNIPDDTIPTGVVPATPAHWEEYTISGIGAAACTGGVRIRDPYDSIGTTNVPTHHIRRSSANTFYANVRNDMGQNANIQVQFRLANWGSTSEWRNIGTPVPKVVNAGTDDTLNSSWQPDASVTVPGTMLDEVTFYTANWHQCILAELQAAGGTVNFTRANAARNMDFVAGSQIRREAEISVRGLNDGFKLPQRDVYIYVERFNAPVQVDGRTAEQYARVRELWAQVNNPNGDFTQEQRYVAVLQRNYEHLPFIEDFDAAAQWAIESVEKGHIVAQEGIFDIIPNLPIVNRVLAELLRRTYDQIKSRLPELRENPLGWRQDPVVRNRVDSFLSNLVYVGPVTLPEPDPEVLNALTQFIPTIRYHVYRDSGDREQINGEWRPVLNAQPSFGYFVGFDHDVEGWELRLEGAQKVAENWYLLAVPTNGVKQVVTNIHAVQPDERELIAPAEPIVRLPTYQPPGDIIADGDGCRVLIENLFKFVAGLLGRR